MAFLSRLCPCLKSDTTPTLCEDLLWSTKLGKYFGGEFSFSVVQANQELEDHSQVEVGRNALFAGVYDGHGGAVAARFVRDNLFRNLIGIINNDGPISEDIIRGAFAATEGGFLSLVEGSYGQNPAIAHHGSCCLVAIIWNATLYVANLGDSRAVLGTTNRPNNIVAQQLTNEHNAKREEIRQELKDLHPDDPTIVIERDGAWRVKGLIQVSRAIGDAFLKRPEYRFDESVPRFHLPEPIIRPVLSAVPTVRTTTIDPSDHFLILASDGLWDQMTNQEAVNFVYNNPRRGIARGLVERAIAVAASKIGLDIKDPIDPTQRRAVHDDITVIVIFNDLWRGRNDPVRQISVKGFIDGSEESQFTSLEEIDEQIVHTTTVEVII